MNTETTNLTTISSDDLTLVEQELARTSHPLSLRALTEKLAYQKTAGQRAQEVKKYDPECRYEVGDFVYKEYNETLTVGSKAFELFQGAVIIKITGKTFYKSFNCEMLEVDYPGGGVFRKYIDYMKKTRTQVFLPSNLEGKAKACQVMDKADDPRLNELPMMDRDLRMLEKNLRARLVKSPKVFTWNDFWQLSEKRVDIPEDKVREIEAGFAQSGASASTEELVRRHFALEPSHDLFETTCLSLSALLEKKYKKEFILLSLQGWGKWILKKILNAMPQGLPLAAAAAPLPELEEIEKPEMSIVREFPIKVYLTWREILSGGIKVPRSLSKEMASAREYTLHDPEESKSYTVYFFPDGNYFLGLRDFYASNNIPQGTSLTLEKGGPAQFNFWVKKSKKKLAVFRLAYDPEKDEFRDTGEDVFSFAEPNKIIYIERETLVKLLPLAAERGDLDLRALLVMIFKNPALAGNSHSLHFLRAYHLVDILRQTTQEDVEQVLLNSPEFAKSDKKKGIFFYQEPYAPKEEAPAEVSPGALALETVLEEGMVEEPGAAVGEEGEFVVPPSETPLELGIEEKEKAKAGPPLVPAKKEKPKKKKAKPEGEKGPRPRKSERRVIEERIAEEESEHEALSAIKEKEETAEEAKAREKKEVFKPAAKEEPKFGFFAEILKSALTQKKKEEKPETEDSPEPEKAGPEKE